MPFDFPLGESTEDSTRIMYLPYKSRDEGTVILGQTRFGKSSLLLRMVEQDIYYNQAAIILDPHSDLINDILANIKLPTEPLFAAFFGHITCKFWN